MRPEILQNQRLHTAKKKHAKTDVLETFPVVTATQSNEQKSYNTDFEKEYVFRALSHDIDAYLKVLEFSFHQYEQLVRQLNPLNPSLKPSSDKQEPIFSEKHVSDERILISHPGSPKPNTHISWESVPTEPVPRENTECLSEAAEHVTACLQETKKFVADLILFTKTGKIDMEPELVSINSLVDEILFEQKQLLDKRQIELTVSPCLPNVYANRSRVKQLLTNLIRNAAIHGCDQQTPQISIFPNTFQAVYIRQTRYIPLSSFFIQDNGPGIPKQYQANLFQPGYRIPGNQKEGTGVGLAVARKIARYYQGEVLLESNPNGTTFTVMLPRAD